MTRNHPAEALLAATILLAAAPSAVPAHLDHLKIVQHDHGYNVAFDAVINAPRARVFAILSDFANLGRINPDIRSSSFATAPSGLGQRVRTVIHSCVWIFCRTLVQVEDVTEQGTDTIIARIVPGAGDFASGSSRWQLTEDGASTHLHYEATRTTAFWVPPFIGPAAVDRTLRAHFKFSMDALERLASASP